MARCGQGDSGQGGTESPHPVLLLTLPPMALLLLFPLLNTLPTFLHLVNTCSSRLNLGLFSPRRPTQSSQASSRPLVRAPKTFWTDALLGPLTTWDERLCLQV